VQLVRLEILDQLVQLVLWEKQDQLEILVLVKLVRLVL